MPLPAMASPPAPPIEFWKALKPEPLMPNTAPPAIVAVPPLPTPVSRSDPTVRLASTSSVAPLDTNTSEPMPRLPAAAATSVPDVIRVSPV